MNSTRLAARRPWQRSAFGAGRLKACGQDCRARQCLCRGSQAPGVRHKSGSIRLPGRLKSLSSRTKLQIRTGSPLILLSQSEHDTSSQSILITTDEAVAKSVEEAVEAQLKSLTTQKRARAQAWDTHGAFILVPDLESAATVANQIAAEHLSSPLLNRRRLLPQIKHAGAVFLGHHTPEALGDYVTGSNHVLPTSRAARFSSGLGLYDFLKRMSVQKAGPEGFAALAPAAIAPRRGRRLASACAVRLRSGRTKDRSQADNGRTSPGQCGY